MTDMATIKWSEVALLLLAWALSSAAVVGAVVTAVGAAVAVTCECPQAQAAADDTALDKCMRQLRDTEAVCARLEAACRP